MKNLILIDDGAGIDKVFNPLFKVKLYSNDYTFTEDDVVLFTGGEDITPSLYGEPKHRSTYNNPTRDYREEAIFNKAKAGGASFLGICRGAQFLTVMSGGKLIQNVDKHAISGTHPIKTIDGKVLDITSTHHQMCFPYNLPIKDYKLVSWAYPDRCTQLQGIPEEYLDWVDYELKKETFKEPEIIWYKKTKALAIQGHPEYMEYKHETCEYLRYLAKYYFDL